MFSICHKLLISAPVEKVVSALTTPNGLSSWWTRAEMVQNDNVRFDFGDYSKKMKIVVASLPRIVWNCVDGTPE